MKLFKQRVFYLYMFGIYIVCIAVLILSIILLLHLLFKCVAGINLYVEIDKLYVENSKYEN